MRNYNDSALHDDKKSFMNCHGNNSGKGKHKKQNSYMTIPQTFLTTTFFRYSFWLE